MSYPSMAAPGTNESTEAETPREIQERFKIEMSQNRRSEGEVSKEGEAGDANGIVDAARRSSPKPQPAGMRQIKLKML